MFKYKCGVVIIIHTLLGVFILFQQERKVLDDEELNFKNHIDISEYTRDYGIKIPVLVDEDLWKAVRSKRILDDGEPRENGKLKSLIENIIPELMKCRTEGCTFDLYVYNDKEDINRREVNIKYALVGDRRKIILAFK